jgi:hypothetical protein
MASLRSSFSRMVEEPLNGRDKVSSSWSPASREIAATNPRSSLTALPTIESNTG